jgi:hypothetical protein
MQSIYAVILRNRCQPRPCLAVDVPRGRLTIQNEDLGRTGPARSKGHLSFGRFKSFPLFDVDVGDVMR